ncbi:MAG: OmpH family outer membrane protein [Bacteroidales bacterium]|nr:OmpH family outer membrane protein [Bacteroidales bacterium]
MKKYLLILGAVAILACTCSCKQSSSGSSSDNAASENVSVTDSLATAGSPVTNSLAAAGSIVYFNMDKVMSGYDYANDEVSKYETKASGVSSDLERRRKKIEKDMADFQNKLDKGLLTQSVAQAQYQKLQEAQQNFQNYALKKQQEMAEEQQVTMNNISNAIAEYVAEFNKEHNYSMILATSGNVISIPVVTADPKLDITDVLVEGLNAAYIKTKNPESNQ